MGQRSCCVQKRLEFTIDCLSDNSPVIAENIAIGDACVVVSGAYYGNSAASVESRARSLRSRSREDDFSEVAWQIATDRRQQVFEAADLIPVHYEVGCPEPYEPQNIATAVHRKTQVARQLTSFRKPQRAVAQERMRSFVSSLQQLSASSEHVVKVLEVFEDHMNVHLLLEHCTGGTVYERILERQYFTEQESAVLVKQMLMSLLPFHDSAIHHGSLTPHSFRFLSDAPHAPLKLVDFGMELKIHRWDAFEYMHGGPDLQNPPCSQFFETCKLVFCAPEFAPPHEPIRKHAKKKRRSAFFLRGEGNDRQVNGICRSSVPLNGREGSGLLDGELLADILDEHADWVEEQQQDLACDYHKKFMAADMWSVGAISFLLLCGYPPFFAPSRNAILGRIHRTEFSFDPPFWSKISEEAKSFVSSCIKETCWDRLSVHEALEHPWIQTLAGTSPSGAMFSSFMLNLRRFYRTSLIEVYVANELAKTLRRRDMYEFLRRCQEQDACGSGFFTATELKQVLSVLGFDGIADAITARFLRAFRHPGESYIDYISLVDSIALRRERIFEEELWCSIQPLLKRAGYVDASSFSGWLPIHELDPFLSDPAVSALMAREVYKSSPLPSEEVTSHAKIVCQKVQAYLHQYATDVGILQLEFRDLVAVVLRFLYAFPVVSCATPLPVPQPPMPPEPPEDIEAANSRLPPTSISMDVTTESSKAM
eukprot:gnl/TRDRNA2_/TRDRNA2_33457_c0_seq1.p1 gnl/TRDRNA2_/TRDRNA2_33457_c0~~gnl/TRDRNA2_/TRDRNA2_33457_c0_seq1.p1  ORF type:complete len:709 (+),score=151.27 gnl/TRDRNA2_/TRDRNA2_33457_c0_seq1:40-2166(+)